MALLAYGDPHGEWTRLLVAAERDQPEAILIVGDCDLVARSLQEELTPIWKAGVPVWYVPGNHDVDSEATWRNLVDAHPGGSLHGTVQQIAGLAVAGLGGTFEKPIWDAKAGERPAFATREAYFDTLNYHPYRESLMLKHRASIAPSNLDALMAHGSADILLCHEAPSTHRHGVAEIDALADLLRVKLVIHGHHHESYTAELPSGIRVRGLDRAEPWLIEL